MSLKTEMLKPLNAKMIVMKKLINKIKNFVLKTEDRWKLLPIDRQRLLTKVFFGSYVFLTVIIIINVITTIGKRNNTMSINHIEGLSKLPAEKESGQDTIRTSPIKE